MTFFAHAHVQAENWSAIARGLAKGLALAIIELGWLARRFAINQAIGTFGVETQNPVSDTLQTNRPDPRRIQTLATIINRGQRKQPPALPRIL